MRGAWSCGQSYGSSTAYLRLPPLWALSQPSLIQVQSLKPSLTSTHDGFTLPCMHACMHAFFPCLLPSLQPSIHPFIHPYIFPSFHPLIHPPFHNPILSSFHSLLPPFSSPPFLPANRLQVGSQSFQIVPVSVSTPGLMEGHTFPQNTQLVPPHRLSSCYVVMAIQHSHQRQALT